MYRNRFCQYIPEPHPVTTDRIIGVNYYPGWKKIAGETHSGFAELKHYPERCPVLGWYDESNPEVTDWEIKWAVEHGITCFFYCWYRRKENVGKPVTRDDIRLGHAIHDGLFKAAFRNFIKFAIVFENNEVRWGNAKDVDDLLHNLLPWWAEEYFSKPNYLKIDGKPLLPVFHLGAFARSVGGEDAIPDALAKLNDEIRKYGFPGIHVAIRCEGDDETYLKTLKAHLPVRDLSYLDRRRALGFDFGFQYDWHIRRAELNAEQYADYTYADPLNRAVPPTVTIASQTAKIKEHTEYAPDFLIPTASVGFCKQTWRRIFPFNSLTDDPGLFLQEHLTPYAYRALLENIKKVTDALPENAIARKMLILDSWNEWGEGHFISPNCGNGFQYLQAVREVFSKRDNLPDYRTPQMLDFDRYDYDWFPAEPEDGR